MCSIGRVCVRRLIFAILVFFWCQNCTDHHHYATQTFFSYHCTHAVGGKKRVCISCVSCVILAVTVSSHSARVRACAWGARFRRQIRRHTHTHTQNRTVLANTFAASFARVQVATKSYATSRNAGELRNFQTFVA